MKNILFSIRFSSIIKDKEADTDFHNALNTLFNLLII